VEPTARPKRRRILRWILLVLGLALGYWLVQVAIVAGSAARAGFFDAPVKSTWTPDREANLRALHTALRLYMESEGQLPAAAGWSDAVGPRLKTADLSETEARKKLVQPGGAGGYGFNAALAGKHFEDLDSSTVVLFETAKPDLNQHGEPPKEGRGITVAGEVVDLAPR